MTTPQTIMIVLLTIAAATNLLKNGEYYTKNALHTVLFSLPLMVTVLWAGGYWEVIAAPQIIHIVIMTLNCVFALINHGERVKYLGVGVIIDLPMIVALQWLGGFWG